MVLEYTAAAALGTVRAAAIPAAVQTAGLSRGIEQDATYAPLAADQLVDAIAATRVLVAVELLAATRALRYAGSPCPRSWRRRGRSAFGCRRTWTTETSPMTSGSPSPCWTCSHRSVRRRGTMDRTRDEPHTPSAGAQPDEDGLTVTDALHFPLLFSRDGLDPIAELGERRATEPVSKLELPFGITAWLVTGYPAAKEVLGDPASFSNAFGNLTTAGTDDEQDPGGLGMTDPPYHTRLRKMLTPEFTMRRLNRLRPRIEAIVAGQMDAIEAAGHRPTWWICSRCRSRHW